MNTRAERVREAQRLRAEGFLLREIAEQMGAKLKTVHTWLTDPDLSRQRARRETYRGTCIDCGEPTDGSDGPGKAPERCRRCNGIHQGRASLVWTPEKIIAAICEWVAEYGEPPAIADWCTSRGRDNNDEPRARRFEDANGHWPCHTTVIGAFGSWNAAIRAAGLEPRPQGGTTENTLRERRFRGRVVV